MAEGPRRVVFRFRNNQNRELPLILGQLPVLPKHWWEGRDFAKPLLEIPLGSGPYRLERFESRPQPGLPPGGGLLGRATSRR